MLPLASAMLFVELSYSRAARVSGLPLSAWAGFAASTGSLPRVEGVRGLLFNGCLASMAFLGSPGQAWRVAPLCQAGKG